MYPEELIAPIESGTFDIRNLKNSKQLIKCTHSALIIKAHLSSSKIQFADVQQSSAAPQVFATRGNAKVKPNTLDCYRISGNDREAV